MKRDVAKKYLSSIHKRSVLFFLFFLFVLPSFSQLKFALKIIEDLTSPDMHGRGYVNGGDSIAATYIGEQYKQLGAQKFGSSYYQEFSFSVNTFPDSMRISVDGRNLIPGIDYIVDPACPTINKSFNVVYCKGREAFEKIKSTAGEGVIFVFDPDGIKDKDSLKKFNELINKTNLQFPVIRLNETKLTWSVSGDVAKFPSIDILKSNWPENAQKISINVRSVLKTKHKARNVIGYVKGKKYKKSYFVFSAHYDHLGRMGSQTYFPGANDNASGVAQLINLMKYYKENPPLYNIVFIAFAGEEAGLLGSKYYTENPLFDLKKIRFLVNLDIMGTGEEGITVVNATKHKNEFEQLKKINEENDFLIQVKARGEAANSDHYFFSQKDVPAFFIYTLGGSKAYHDVYDKMEGLSFSEFEDISRLLVKFVGTF